MAKSKSKKAYVCTECGSESAKWQGQCPDCKAWNTFKEVNLGPASSPAIGAANKAGFAGTLDELQLLRDVDIEDAPRFSSGMTEFDRVLGGGFVKGSAILIGGHPGAGKSTILLQILCHVAQSMNALYVSGEESMQQIAARANRLGLPNDRLKMLAETSSENIVAVAEQEKPGIIVIDSIQVMYMNGID